MTRPKEVKSDDTFYRTFSLDAKAIDEKKRTVPLAFSSEEPFERYFGIEILSHNPEHVDMSFIGSGRAPFLSDHWRDRDSQIGVIESATIDADKIGRAVVRFSKKAVAEEEFQDVKDGIRVNISVGYQILDKTLIGEKEGTKTYLVTRWRPMEISLVSIPADEKVGVGRGEIATGEEEKTILKPLLGVRKMPDNIEVKKEVPAAEFTAESIDQARRDGRAAAEKAYLDRMAKRDADTKEIIEIGQRLQMNAEAMNFVRDGKSLEDFKAFAMSELEKRAAKPPEGGSADIGMSARDKDKYSFMRALRAVCLGPKDPRFIREAGFEFECSESAAKTQGKEANGLLIPHDMLAARYNSPLMHRTLTAGTTTDGKELVANNLLAGSFIDVLRNLSIAMALGARTMDGLVGNILIPRKTTGASAGWIATETGNAANGEAQFDQVSLTPKTGGVYTDLSRQLLMQSTPSAEALIRDDLAMALVLLIDKAAFYGTGADGQPKGISLQTGINAPTSFAAAVPTWAEVVAMESAVAVDNALFGTLGYALEPAMRGSLKTSPKVSGHPVFIMEKRNELNGYNAAVSSQIVSGDLFFGNFADLIVGFWGGLDILVDPFTNSLSGTVRIVAHQSCDVAVRHPVSFAFNNDGA